MPMINPGIVVASPFLGGSVFWRTRLLEDVGDDGVVSSSKSTTRHTGIVNQASQDDLKTLPEAVQAATAITVLSRVEVSTVAPNQQADIITWRGTDYRVVHCRPYPQYGEGWYKTIAASQNMVNLMPEQGGEPPLDG